MHLDASGAAIDSCFMGEIAQVEIGIEFTVDTGQQIQIESGRDAEFIIVGAYQLRIGFFQIGPQEQRIARFQDSSHFCEKLETRVTVKIPDRAAKEQYQESLVPLAARSDFE